MIVEQDEELFKKNLIQCLVNLIVFGQQPSNPWLWIAGKSLNTGAFDNLYPLNINSLNRLLLTKSLSGKKYTGCVLFYKVNNAKGNP